MLFAKEIHQIWFLKGRQSPKVLGRVISPILYLLQKALWFCHGCSKNWTIYWKLEEGRIIGGEREEKNQTSTERQKVEEMEQGTEFLIRERSSKRHRVACAPEKSARTISSDSHMKRWGRSSTSQRSRTFSKGDTDCGAQAELIRTSSLHKYLEECSFPAVCDRVLPKEAAQPSWPSPSLAVAGDTAACSEWHQPANPRDKLAQLPGRGFDDPEAQSCWSWHKSGETSSSSSVEPGQGRQLSVGLMATSDEN